MAHNNQPTLMLNKTTLKNLSLDGAVIPREATRSVVGGTNDKEQVDGFYRQENVRAASTNITFSSTYPRL
ncbi:hypothetical protein D1814_06880 [Alteromonas sp. BL110]|jgi:hypothetical protein|uniref:hypothetical protein n=1 Tax=Alteromonas sp. BL110 TaxID=1714845 RepID=UPI000E53DFB1|nr:hypothetical protein [Alteromonas sp. BL110]AXT38414.1 hypothetical protein D1814_06880 [Alteromonas sp. BL110]RKM83842.1 hypothetical protein D7031_02050 [Alteromonas sp. BL110]